MAAEGAAAAAVAAGAFGYNRANYLYDAEFRWERFSSAREYANQQAEQYRGDIRSLAALTVKKNTLWCVTSTLCMALCVALYCAGRLGLHGPSPPAWIMGLWLTNNAAAFSFMALCIFLAIHASFRAQAASTQLLTRKTRVPVPTLRQLDEARRFASEFEQQSWGDIFRIPYASNNGAPKTDDAVYEGEDGDQSPRGGRARSAPPERSGRSKCSSWVREEFEADRAVMVEASAVPEDDAPEHFQLWTKVQKEFYQYDIYARICIFYGFIHYVQSLCYYGLGHINIELRAFWTAYGCVFVIGVLMVLMLRFDIVPANPSKKQYLPYCEYLGPLAVLPAAIGMSLDFKVEYDPTSIGICWTLIFIAYIMQLVYSLRMLEIVLPDETFAGTAERLGASYLPDGWRKVPSSFYHVLYFVAPPTKLQPGQHDIVREIKNGGGGAYDEVVGTNANNKMKNGYDHEDLVAPTENAEIFQSTKHVEPWRLVATIAAVLPIGWCFLIFGCIVDVALGEQALVTAPHWSRPPMTRLSKRPHELGTPIGMPWPAGARPWIPEQMAWHEEKRHAETTSFHRRLKESDSVGIERKAFASKHDLSTALTELLASMDSADQGTRVSTQVASERVVWPAFFEPKVVACGAAGHVTAITPHGFGASVVLAGDSEVSAQSFRLSGLTQLPRIVGASVRHDSSGDAGLVLVSLAGHVVECSGPRAHDGATWSCMHSQAVPQLLPVPEDTRLRSAAVAEVEGIVHAALVLENEPKLVALFVHQGQTWLPLGEVQVPGTEEGVGLSVAFVDDSDLLVTTASGNVLRVRLSDGIVVASERHAVNHEGTSWQAACGHGSQVSHLRLRQTGSTAYAWRPEIVTAELNRVDALDTKPEVFA